MASSLKKTRSDQRYLVIKALCIACPNTRVHHIARDDPKNWRGYAFLLFYTNKTLQYKGGRTVVEYQEEGRTQAWYQLHHNPDNSTPYLGLPCPEVNEFDVEPHPTDEVSYVIKDDSEPETPFTPNPKGKQRDNQQNDSDIEDPLMPASITSTNKQLIEAKKQAALIRQSPIGEKNPIPLDKMSTTQTVPTITIQMAMVTSTTTQTSKQCIATAINTSLKRNPKSGPLGGEGSPGAEEKVVEVAEIVEANQ